MQKTKGTIAAGKFSGSGAGLTANTTPLSTLVRGTNGQLPIAQTSAATAYKTVSGDVSIDKDGATSIASDIVQRASVALSAANILAMNGAPVQVLAAPGTGKVIVVESILFEMTTTSTQFANGGAVSFVYHGGSTACHAGSVLAAVVNAGAGTTATLLGPAVATNGTTVPANAGIDITNGTAAFITGTGTANVFIKYRVLTLL